MKRPLSRDADKSGEWTTQLLSHKSKDDLIYPILCWNFGTSPDSPEIRVFAWPLRKSALVLKFVGIKEMLTFYKFEDLLVRIDEGGWGEPPHIDEIFYDLEEITQTLSGKRGNVVEQVVLADLRAKWGEFVARARKNEALRIADAREFWDKHLVDLDMDLFKPPQ